MERCYIAPAVFNRWVIAKANHPDLAWSGSEWVGHRNGVPIDGIHVSNFDTKLAAFKEADKIGFGVEVKGFFADAESITCFRCGMSSWSPEDIRNRFCGNCRIFHTETRND